MEEGGWEAHPRKGGPPPGRVHGVTDRHANSRANSGCGGTLADRDWTRAASSPAQTGNPSNFLARSWRVPGVPCVPGALWAAPHWQVANVKRLSKPPFRDGIPDSRGFLRSYEYVPSIESA